MICCVYIFNLACSLTQQFLKLISIWLKDDRLNHYKPILKMHRQRQKPMKLTCIIDARSDAHLFCPDDLLSFMILFAIRHAENPRIKKMATPTNPCSPSTSKYIL